MSRDGRVDNGAMIGFASDTWGISGRGEEPTVLLDALPLERIAYYPPAAELAAITAAAGL
jgi:hypothetical protein